MKKQTVLHILNLSVKVLLHAVTLTVFILLCAGLYGATLRGVKGNIGVDQGNRLTSQGEPFESSHERAPYALLLSIDENHSINLTQKLANFGSPDVGFYQGKFFILFPPGISLLIYPLYEYGKSVGMSQLFAYATISLFGLGNIFMLYVISLQIFRMPRWAGMLTGLLFAFGTTSWSYAITIYQHIPTTFFVLLGFYAAWRYKQRQQFHPLWGMVVWACYGIGVFIDFPSVFLMAPVMLYFLVNSIGIEQRKEGNRISFNLAFIISSFIFFSLMGGHGYYNKVAFGDWKKFGQSFTRYEGEEKFQARLDRQQAEASAAAALASSSGTLVQKPTAASNPFSVFKESKIVNGVTTLTIADDKGIFYYSPVLLIGLFGILFFRKKLQQEHYFLISIIIVNLVLYASFADPWGGWAYGPRYLIPSMSILSLFTVLTLVWFKKYSFAARLAFFPLFLASSAIALLGVITTNVVPPSVEGIALGLPYNYVANIFYLLKGVTGSFVYNNYFWTQFTLSEYVAILYGIVVVIAIFITFIMPLFSKVYDD